MAVFVSRNESSDRLLVYLVWEGWRTIVRQRVDLEVANEELESRVAARVEDLRNALDQGRRRVDAFRSAAGRLALEEDSERGLQELVDVTRDLVDVTRDLVDARYGALALMGRREHREDSDLRVFTRCEH